MENKSDSKSDFKSSWNMAGLLVLEANAQRIAANSQFNQARYSKAIRHLISLKHTISGVIGVEEMKKLSAIEKKFLVFERASHVIHGKSQFDKGIPEQKAMVNNKLHFTYDEYNSLIMNLMQAKDMLLDKKKDDTKLNL